MKSLFITAALVVLGAQAEAALELNYASDIDPAQVALMKQDVATLPTLTVDDADGDVARLFQIPLNGAGYEAWLAERAHYIVSESLDLQKSVGPAGLAIYPKTPNMQHEVVTVPPPERPASQGKVVVMMSNLGGMVYSFGKMSKMFLMGVDIPGQGKVKVNSPRIGIFQIGEGHFMPLLRHKGVTENTSYANSLFRLGTFIHEARHSDSNGATQGFPHAVCPQNHNFAGYYACDRSLNGPYTIGAVFVKSVLKNCATCSEGEKEALLEVALDSFNRVIKVSPPAQTVNNAETLDVSCKKLRNLLGTMINTCYAGAATELPYSPGYVPSVDWDATPEAARLSL